MELHALIDLIEAANAARRQGNVATDIEDQLDSLFGTRKRLAVYGSLAPGRQNHHIVEPLGGSWSEGLVEGDLVTYGWGAAIGFRALYPRRGGPAVPVHVLASANLAGTWATLDAFEGVGYRRVLVPVWSGAKLSAATLLTVANVYEAALPLMPEAHLFEAVVSAGELRAADSALAARVTRDVLDAAVGAVPNAFLAPLAERDAQPVEKRRAAYASFLWKRLKAPRPFLEARALPPPRPRRTRRAWLQIPGTDLGQSEWVGDRQRS